MKILKVRETRLKEAKARPQLQMRERANVFRQHYLNICFHVEYTILDIFKKQKLLVRVNSRDRSWNNTEDCQ